MRHEGVPERWSREAFDASQSLRDKGAMPSQPVARYKAGVPLLPA